jgi:DNA ligase-1
MSANWIRKLTESDSRLHKEDVLRQALELTVLGNQDADTFLSFVKVAYDPMTTFGIKQVPTTIGIIEVDNHWTDFADLLFALKNRELTGHAARDAVEVMSQRFTSDDWNTFCVGVLTKDLRAGISDKTINKICKRTKYEIPIFGCQLATDCTDRPEMSGVKRLEPKLDGVRVLMVCSPTGVISYSRNGKVFENFGHIEQQLLDNMQELVSRTGHDNFVLDGEVVGKSFQALMKQARKKEGAQADDCVFHVFDFIPMADFTRGHWNASLKTRLKMCLEKIQPVTNKMPNLELLPSLTVDLDTGEGLDQLERYARDQVQLGYEGIMIKSLDAPYECKRSTSWLKWKPTITVDLPVIDMEEGTGRNSGRLGALVCSGTDHGKSITVNVGSGFSDDDRTEYWINRNYVIGKTAEILCDVITQNQDGTYSLRFPRFVRFRDDK